MTTESEGRRKGDTVLRRAIDEATRYVVIVLLVMIVVLGFYVQRSIDAANGAKNAANHASAAGDRAATAADKASTDLAGAIAQAASNPNSSQAVARALTQIDETERVICAMRPDVCDQVLGHH